MAQASPDHPFPLRTPLYSAHVAAGARMVEFAGWLMPIQYRSILAEHEAVRTGVGVFDLSHMGRLVLRGRQAKDLVQWLTTNDVSALSEGQAQYSLVCNPEGGIKDDVVLYRQGGKFLMVVNAANRSKLLAWIATQRQARDLEAEVVDATQALAMVGVQGPEAQRALQRLVEADLETIGYYRSLKARVDGTQGLVARTGYTGEDGFELIVPAEEAVRLWERLLGREGQPAPVACGLGARDTLRLEAGMPLYGHELDELTTPYEAGLGRVVKLEKGEFVGREALVALRERPPRRRLVGFQMVDNAVPRQGYPVLRAGQVVGAVTSGGFAPTLKINLGMAYVPPELAGPGQELEVEVRGSPRRARVVPMPFYPHRTRRGARRGTQDGTGQT